MATNPSPETSFMSDRVFLDTNILVYAHDSAAGSKHMEAAELVTSLWREGNPAISTQVLQEFYVMITHKVARPVGADTARRWVARYLNWHVVANDGGAVLAAIDLQRQHQISFWDALIIHAAAASKATILLSEDLNDGQLYQDVRVSNPFSSAPAAP